MQRLLEQICNEVQVGVEQHRNEALVQRELGRAKQISQPKPAAWYLNNVQAERDTYHHDVSNHSSALDCVPNLCSNDFIRALVFEWTFKTIESWESSSETVDQSDC